ncbi:mannose-1-phosphate guanylyltransferase [candidate division KSB1 bacterium]
MYAVIMAGGVGKRFWPWSRRENPKQFLRLFGEKALIQNTVDRLKPVVKDDNIFIVTNEVQKKKTVELLPSVKEENIIAEPFGRNTAPCIGLSAVLLEKIDPEAVQVVLPADHLIIDDKEFRKVLKNACKAAEDGTLVTIGITPTRPATGYGYIQFNDEIDIHPGFDVFKVKTFAEKPDFETAKRFLKSGDFLWNSGMFIWKVKTILKEIKKNLPDLYEILMKIRDSIGTDNFNSTLVKEYKRIEAISIDYGVMEKAENVAVLKGDFGWSDIGGWEEFYRLGKKDKKNNVVIGEGVLRDSNFNLVYSNNRLIACLGINDMVVIDTDDVVLVCPRDKTEEINKMVDYLNKKKFVKYL